MEYNEIESFLKMIDKDLMTWYKRPGVIKFYNKELGLSYRTVFLITSGKFKDVRNKLNHGTKLALESFIKRYTDGDVDMSILEDHKRSKLRAM